MKFVIERGTNLSRTDSNQVRGSSSNVRRSTRGSTGLSRRLRDGVSSSLILSLPLSRPSPEVGDLATAPESGVLGHIARQVRRARDPASVVDALPNALRAAEGA